MPTAKKAATKEEELFEQPTIDELDLQDFLEEIGPSTSVIHILRMKPDGGRPQCGKTTMDQIREDPWEYLRVNHGPGKYMLMFRGSDRRIHGGKVLEVEGAPENQNSGKPNGNGNGFYEEKIPFHDRLMLYHLMKPQTPTLDVGAMMMGLAAIMTAIKPAEGKPAADPLEIVKTVMGMYESLKKKDEKDPLTQLREVAGVIKDFTPESGGDSMWGVIGNVTKDLIDKGSTVLNNYATAQARTVPAATPAHRFIPAGSTAPAALPAPQAQPASSATPGALPAGLPAGTVMAGAGQPTVAPVAGGPAPVVAPGGVPATVPMSPAPVPSGAVPGTQEENLQKWLAAQINVLKTKARTGKDPGYWIDYFFENPEEPGCQAVAYAVRQGATFENLISFDPEIGQDVQLSGWFRYFYDGFRNGRYDDGEWVPGLLQAPMDSGGQGGNARDYSANGVVVPPGPNGAAGGSPSIAVPDTDIH